MWIGNEASRCGLERNLVSTAESNWFNSYLCSRGSYTHVPLLTVVVHTDIGVHQIEALIHALSPKQREQLFPSGALQLPRG